MVLPMRCSRYLFEKVYNHRRLVALHVAQPNPKGSSPNPEGSSPEGKAVEADLPQQEGALAASPTEPTASQEY